MNVQYLRDNTLQIPGHQFDLRKVNRRELGVAILNALDVRVANLEAANVLSEVQVTKRDGLFWIDAADAPFMGLPLKSVAATPELLGALVLEALKVPPARTSNEDLIYVEFDGRAVALLTNPRWEEMFWTSYEVVAFEEGSNFDRDWWLQDGRIEYRQATTRDTLMTFASNCGETGCVTIRGMTGGEVLAGPTMSRMVYRAVHARRVRRYALIVSAVLALAWMLSSC